MVVLTATHEVFPPVRLTFDTVRDARRFAQGLRREGYVVGLNLWD